MSRTLARGGLAEAGREIWWVLFTCGCLRYNPTRFSACLIYSSLRFLYNVFYVKSTTGVEGGVPLEGECTGGL